MQNLISFAGIFFLIAFAWAISENRRSVNWKTVGWGVALQLLFGLFVFVFPIGTKVFLILNDIVVKVLDSATAGTKFLFGRLALPPGAVNEAGEQSMGFFLAFQALPTIVFFASLMAGLYYIGAMPWLIRQFSKVFTKLMEISGAESLCAASNIFVGVESATTIRPHLKSMTRSELCTVLTAGMATIASSMMAFYVFVLKGQFPTIAGHLISASILSAPAAVLMSKVLVPETGRPETLGLNVAPHYEKESSIMESIINGANAGLKLVAGIVALLLAFLGIMAMIDMFFVESGRMMGFKFDMSLTSMLGYVFYPFTLAIGVSPSDAMPIARIIGERVMATEVKSYQDLAALMASGGLKDPRSAVLAVYALCGFTHIASLAIFIGGTSALAPSRTKDITSVGLRAFVAATLACLMTASVAGVFYTSRTILLGP